MCYQLDINIKMLMEAGGKLLLVIPDRLPCCFFPEWEGKFETASQLCSFLCAVLYERSRKQTNLSVSPAASSVPLPGHPLPLPNYALNSVASFYALMRSLISIPISPLKTWPRSSQQTSTLQVPGWTWKSPPRSCFQFWQ